MEKRIIVEKMQPEIITCSDYYTTVLRKIVWKHGPS